MNLLFLKTIKGELMTTQQLTTQQFAVLVEPEIAGVIHSDKELYECVKRNGRAVIQPIEFFIPVGALQILSLDDFEGVWQGD